MNLKTNIIICTAVSMIILYKTFVHNDKDIGRFYLSEIHNGIYYLYESDDKSVLKKRNYI